MIGGVGEYELLDVGEQGRGEVGGDIWWTGEIDRVGDVAGDNNGEVGGETSTPSSSPDIVEPEPRKQLISAVR